MYKKEFVANGGVQILFNFLGGWVRLYRFGFKIKFCFSGSHRICYEQIDKQTHRKALYRRLKDLKCRIVNFESKWVN